MKRIFHFAPSFIIVCAGSSAQHTWNVQAKQIILLIFDEDLLSKEGTFWPFLSSRQTVLKILSLWLITDLSALPRPKHIDLNGNTYGLCMLAYKPRNYSIYVKN